MPDPEVLTAECHVCRGRGQVNVPSCDMEQPAFSNICSNCRGSGRVKLPKKEEKTDAG